MEYQLVFSPRLTVRSDDFVANWNEEASTQAVAQARLAPNSNKAYNDPLLDVVVLVVTNVGFGLATNALYDLIKGALAKKEHKARSARWHAPAHYRRRREIEAV